MSKRVLIIASFLGLAFAAAATVILGTTVLSPSVDSLVLALDVVAAGIAGRVILGRRRPFRYLMLGIVVFSGVGAGFFTTAIATFLLFGRVTGDTTSSAITGAILYLIAATLYGFAGTRLGVRLPGRIGLLLLLLLAVVPGLNVAGMIGFAILAFVRRPWVTPERPAASV